MRGDRDQRQLQGNLAWRERLWRMWERERGMEEVDSEVPSLCPVKVEEHQGCLGGGEGVHGVGQNAL